MTSRKVDSAIDERRSTEREMDSDCVYPETNKGKGFVGESVA
jgi:hypothetical protein